MLSTEIFLSKCNKKLNYLFIKNLKVLNGFYRDITVEIQQIELFIYQKFKTILMVSIEIFIKIQQEIKLLFTKI
jgi:hypothetical protein